MSILLLEDVVKTYESKVAVDRVSFEMPEGAIFGLLGPNGAGKTSLIRIITTITRADSGRVLFDGQPLNDENASQIGYMPEERGLYKKMKVGEQLLYLAQLRGLTYQQAREELNYWLVKFDIKDWWNKKIEELSKGMQQKVQFVATVIHKPRLLILDEPFSGLDPINANLIKEEIDELHRNGTSIIFSTHRMEQVEEICNEIVLINQGRNILEGNVKSIKARYKENLFRVDFSGELPPDLGERFDVATSNAHSFKVRLGSEHTSNELLQYLIGYGTEIVAFKEILPTLNEIFIRCVEQNS